MLSVLDFPSAWLSFGSLGRMKTLVILFLSVGLLAGCASTRSKDFVQGSIRITPPIQTYYGNIRITSPMQPYSYPLIIRDGGTFHGTIKDAKGRTFPYYIDHRMGTKTPGAIYLMAYPGDLKSVRILDEAEFRQKLGF